MRILNKIGIYLIRLYKKYLSPLKGGKCCNFYPECPEYAIQALEKYNFFKAMYLIIKRLLRCNPFTEYKYDPLR